MSNKANDLFLTFYHPSSPTTVPTSPTVIKSSYYRDIPKSNKNVNKVEKNEASINVLPSYSSHLKNTFKLKNFRAMNKIKKKKEEKKELPEVFNNRKDIQIKPREPEVLVSIENKTNVFSDEKYSDVFDNIFRNKRTHPFQMKKYSQIKNEYITHDINKFNRTNFFNDRSKFHSVNSYKYRELFLEDEESNHYRKDLILRKYHGGIRLFKGFEQY
ncbi:MAG: hypothetical protein MJ252_09800 [archaeon]|nr:hypothetical protein [archaeon]